MTTSSLVFGAALLILLAIWVGWPLREPVTGGGPRRRLSRRQQLLDRKAALYAAIHEIDHDVQVGTLEPADHRALRARYVAEAAGVLRDLEEEASEDPDEDLIDLAIEMGVSRLKEGARSEPAVRAEGGRYCGACGAAAEPDDRFCSRCGAGLKE